MRSMKTDQKITVIVPQNLLKKARSATGKGITATIHQGLELLAASQAYNDLRSLKGKVEFSIKLKELREDRL